MSDGFLGFDASFMLDAVVCALVLVVPALAWSIVLVKRGAYRLHRNLQLTIGAALLLAVAAFEIDVQLVHGGWENIVNKPGRPTRLDSNALDAARRVLWIHLIFAVSTPVLWIAAIALALRRFGNPPVPGPHSGLHKKLAWASVVDLSLTSITGVAFYYWAFMR